MFELKDLAMLGGLVSIVFGIVWRERQYSAKYMTKEVCNEAQNNIHQTLQRIDKNISKIWEKVNETSQDIARIEGYMNGKKNSKG